MEPGNLSSYKETYDSFTVDMEPFSHPTNKDLTLNSSLNLQRNQSRKGPQRGVEKKMNIPSTNNERDAISSPRGSISKKSMLVTEETPDHTINTLAHHQISIITSNVVAATANSTGISFKNRLIGKRSSSSKQSSIINPRRILFFFASLSSMGTILLIYFTLAMTETNA